MSVLKTFNIALDTKQELYLAPFTLYTGDTGNRFVITLTDDGTAVDLSGCRVSVVFSGGMGTAMQDSWTGTGDVTISGTSHNIITIDVHNGAYAVGLNTCQVEVYSGVDYGTLITSAFFTFTGEKPILDDETIQAVEAYPTIVYWNNVLAGFADREQSNWTQTDNTKGNYIQNKPVAGTGFQDATQNLTAETTLANADTVPFYDASATAHRKSTWANIVSTIRTLFFGTTSGVLKANGSGVISAAVSNTDYAAAQHKSRHATGGPDALAPSDIGAASLTSGKVNPTEACSATTLYSASHTLALADNGKMLVEDSTSAIVVTVPPDVFPAGAEIEICWWNTGAVSIAAGSGVTLCSLYGNWASRNISGRYGVAVLKYIGSNTWILAGALA